MTEALASRPKRPAARAVEVVLTLLLLLAAGLGFYRLNRPLPNADALVVSAVPEDAVVVDARGPLAYRQGHLAGAHHLYARELLSFEDGGGLASPDALAERLRALGLSPGEPVVVYDAGDGRDAPLVTLMLRAFDVDARMLEGGLEAWRERGGDVSDAVPDAPEPSDARFSLDERLLAGADEAREHLEEGAIAPLDVRSRAEYEREHVEGAVHLPADALLAGGELPRWSELADRLEPARITRDTHPFVYGGDVREAARAFLALRAYGIDHLHVHRGSYEALERAGLPLSQTESTRASSERSSSICWR